MFKVENVAETTATVRVVLPLGSSFFVCAKRPQYEKEKLMKNDVLFRHQGTALYNTVSIFSSGFLTVDILGEQLTIRLNVKISLFRVETIIYSSGLSDQHI